MSSRITPFDRMEQFFEQMMTGGMSMPRAAGQWRSGLAGPAIRTEPTETGVVVLADLPGFEKSEIDLSVQGGVLTISAVHEVEGDDHYYNRRVHEEVAVPDDAIVEDIEARYTNGVLEVSVPTESPVEHDESHRIDIA